MKAAAWVREALHVKQARNPTNQTTQTEARRPTPANSNFCPASADAVFEQLESGANEDRGKEDDFFSLFD